MFEFVAPAGAGLVSVVRWFESPDGSQHFSVTELYSGGVLANPVTVPPAGFVEVDPTIGAVAAVKRRERRERAAGGLVKAQDAAVEAVEKERASERSERVAELAGLLTAEKPSKAKIVSALDSLLK